MKSFVSFAIAFFCTISAQADVFEPRGYGLGEAAGDTPVVQVLCKDLRELRDAGLRITIQSGGFIGLTTAVVARRTAAGPEILGNIEVDRQIGVERNAGLVAYNGEKFRLVINTNEQEKAYFPARMRAKVDGISIFEDLKCRLVK